MRSGIGVMARKIKLAVSGGRFINYILQLKSYSFERIVFIVWIKCFSFEKYFLFLSLVIKWL